MISRQTSFGVLGGVLAWSSVLLLAAVSFAQVAEKPAGETAHAIPAAAAREASPLADISDESRLVALRDAAAAKGELIEACDAEMRRVAVRRENGHAYKDKIDLVGIYGTLIAKSPALSDGRKEKLLGQLEAYALKHQKDSEYGWRVWQLAAAIANDMGDAKRARQLLAKSIEEYPFVKYEIPSKYSKFQHLLNEMAMMIWDAEGLDAAEQYIREKWQGDRRFMYFFDLPWRQRFDKEGIDTARLDAFAKSLGDKPPLRPVEFLLTPDGPQYDGKPLSWDELEARLAGIPDRTNCFLAMGITDDRMTVRDFDRAQGRAIRLVQRLHYDHFSYVGLQTASKTGESKK